MKTPNKFLPYPINPLWTIDPLNQYKDWSRYAQPLNHHPLVRFNKNYRVDLDPGFVRQESKRSDKILMVEKKFDQVLRSMIRNDRPIRHDVIEFEVNKSSIFFDL